MVCLSKNPSGVWSSCPASSPATGEAMWRTLPDELKACCASFLDTPSAGRFAAASREGQRLMLMQLVFMKLIDTVAAWVAAQAAQETHTGGAAAHHLQCSRQEFHRRIRRPVQGCRAASAAAHRRRHLGGCRWTSSRTSIMYLAFLGPGLCITKVGTAKPA